MTLAEFIPIAISLSMGLIVLALGLGANFTDATYLFRHPGLIVRSVAAMNVIMLAFAVVVDRVFELPPGTEIAIAALALSPVPPILPTKQAKAGGTEGYVVSLLVVAAALAIVIVPFGAWILTLIFPKAKEVPLAPIAMVVFTSVLLPLAIGLIVHQFAPAFSVRISRWISMAGSILLIVAFIPVLIMIWPQLVAAVAQGTTIAVILFTIIGLAAGHILGGPVEDNRVVLALATGTRHPSVALAIAAATFPEEKAVLVVVLWHLIVAGVISAPYALWRSRQHASHAGPAP